MCVLHAQAGEKVVCDLTAVLHLSLTHGDLVVLLYHSVCGGWEWVGVAWVVV